MAGGLDVLIEEAEASLRYQSLKEKQERAAKAFVEEMDVRIFVRVRRVSAKNSALHPESCRHTMNSNGYMTDMKMATPNLLSDVGISSTF